MSGTVAAFGDRYDAARVLAAPPALALFNTAGVLAPADVHVAGTLCRLAGEASDDVLLAAALAVRAPRLQHVCVDLRTVRGTVTTAEETAEDAPAAADLSWPHPDRWIGEVAGSPLVAVGPVGGEERPLRLIGSLLYLDRYWRYEQRVVAALSTRGTETVDSVDRTLLRNGLDRLFPPADGAGPDLQRLAGATAVLRRLTVVAGGPGTGKTTTVAGILALLEEQAAAGGLPPPAVALAAPTGKAAARLEESIAESVSTLDTSEDIARRIGEVSASTIHRLLGSHPANRTRFRHDAANPLPNDVVVVDETSMVSLSLIAKLLDAVRADARVVLLGDPQQLASVEAGAVLGDIVGPADLRLSGPARQALEEVTGEPMPGLPQAHGAPRFGDGVIILRRVHRFRRDSGIAALAAAVQAGDDDATVGVLTEGHEDISWANVDPEADGLDHPRLGAVRRAVSDAGAAVVAAARAGDAREALTALSRLRVLCAHRRGPAGVTSWVPTIERWLSGDVAGFTAAEPWYPGRPLLVTQNDYQLGVFNGDVGVAGRFADERILVAFEDRDSIRLVSPTRLEAIETVHAMTIHKSQGSQFQSVVVVLPGEESRILTRELLYTAVTRARRDVTLVGTEAAIRAAVARPVQRASGLRAALWGA